MEDLFEGGFWTCVENVPICGGLVTCVVEECLWPMASAGAWSGCGRALPKLRGCVGCGVVVVVVIVVA